MFGKVKGSRPACEAVFISDFCECIKGFSLQKIGNCTCGVSICHSLHEKPWAFMAVDLKGCFVNFAGTGAADGSWWFAL